MASDFPQLVILTGPEEGLEYTLPSEGFVKIGRADNNDLVLSDNSVSRHHVVLSKKNEGYVIRDEGSSNGTSVEKQKLKPKQDRPLSHLDEIKIGIYELRFLIKPFADDDLQEKKQTSALREKYKSPEDKTSASQKSSKKDLNQTDSKTDDADPSLKKAPKQQKRKRLFIVSILIALVLVVGVIVFFWLSQRQNRPEISEWDEKDFQESFSTEKNKTNSDVKNEVLENTTKDNKPIKETIPQKTKEAPKNDESKVTVQKPSLPKENIDATKLDSSTNNEKNQVTFVLDVKTDPPGATIYLGKERLGRAPFKKSLILTPNVQYDVFADYDLRELNDIYRQKKIITVKPHDDVMDLDFSANIGQLQIKRLPRHVEFYLYGYYDYDSSKKHPVTVTDVRYGRPIYLPYGKYRLNLKENIRVAGSENTLSTIRYQRDYTIDRDNPVINLYILEKDLKVFPAIIKTKPSGALLYLNNEKIGETPFTGELPVGKNKLVLKKDGFFDEVLDLDMPMNSIYETKLDLKTSKVGEFIQDAKEHIRFDRKDQAIYVLVEALKYGGSLKERSEIYYLLGKIYYEKNNFDLAEAYFLKAGRHEDFKDQAKLALAQVWHRQGKEQAAIAKVAEVMVSLKKDAPVALKQEANAVFKKLSPVKSVIYVYSEPGDATVFLNDKPVSQKTPLLLSNLGLGNYRIQVEKPGYKTYTTKQNLKIGEFVLVSVKLQKQNF